MRYYTVQDKEMKAITDGLYQYGVEIEIEDGIVKHLEDNLSEHPQSGAVAISHTSWQDWDDEEGA